MCGTGNRDVWRKAPSVRVRSRRSGTGNRDVWREALSVRVGVGMARSAKHVLK